MKQGIVHEISPHQVHDWLKEGAVLVDVREKFEFESYRLDIPEQINIPLSDFEDLFNSIPAQRKIVLVCSSGLRSLRAGLFLLNKSDSPIANLKFGIEQWIEEGFPLIGTMDDLKKSAKGYDKIASFRNENRLSDEI